MRNTNSSKSDSNELVAKVSRNFLKEFRQNMARDGGAKSANRKTLQPLVVVDEISPESNGIDWEIV